MDALDTTGAAAGEHGAARSGAPLAEVPLIEAPLAETPLSAATATPRQRGAGIAMVLSSTASNQTGAALGALSFPVIGPVGVVAMRQLVTAAVLAPLVRPRFRGLRRDQWLPVLGLVVVFSVMNLGLYTAVERIGLGLAVTLEFLGPLVAALAWACYILLNRSVGQRLPGLQGTAVASTVTALIWLPIAVVWFVLHPPTVVALGLAAACGLLSSVVPYVAGVQTLRRVPAHLFGTLSSISPVWAVLAGLVFLGQALEVREWVGVLLIVLSNVLVSLTAGRTRR